MLDKEKFAETLYNIPTPFHYVSHARSLFTEHGFQEISESATDVNNNFPEKFFVVRDNRCICAVKMGIDNSRCIVFAAHNDSPCFKAKPNYYGVSHGFKQASVQQYGGISSSTYIDRDLRIAGRALITANSEKKEDNPEKTGNVDKEDETTSSSTEKVEGEKKECLFSTNYVVGHIPSISPCLASRSDLSPKFTVENSFNPIIIDKLENVIAKELNIEASQIESAEIFFIDHQKPSYNGTDESLLSSARLDDLVTSITGLNAYLAAETKYTSVFCIYDNEEIGSMTRCGARSNFLPSILRRISHGDDTFTKKSFMISADVNNGCHHNYLEITPASSVKLGDGVLISYDPNLMFSSEMKTNAIVKEIARKSNIPISVYCDRNDKRGGITFGPMVSTNLGIPSIDIGIPVLAMHSARETCCFRDVESFQNLLIEIVKNFGDYIE